MSIDTGRALIGLLIMMVVLIAHAELAAKTPCDSAFWTGYRMFWGLVACSR